MPQLNYLEIHFPELASLYCSHLWLAMKEVCVRFGRYLCCSSHVSISTGWCRAPGAMATCNIAADQVVQFIVDSQLFNLPPDLLLMLSLSLIKYVCSMVANDIHFSWRSPSTLSLKEVREKDKVRCTLWVPLSSYISIHVTVCPCFCPHPTLLHKCYSGWLSVNSDTTPNTNITFFICI